jgi:hypothetical protein
VKGKSEPQLVHEAFEPQAVGDGAFIGLYERALAAWQDRRVGEARALFAQADAARPGGDPPSRLHLAWCDELVAKGLPAGFEPVLAVHK